MDIYFGSSQYFSAVSISIEINIFEFRQKIVTF